MNEEKKMSNRSDKISSLWGSTNERFKIDWIYPFSNEYIILSKHSVNFVIQVWEKRGVPSGNFENIVPRINKPTMILGSLFLTYETHHNNQSKM